MSDQTFREIQLGTKQLVFLFMASVVLAVAIFLLGVSVGRGVRGATLAGGASTTDTSAPASPAAPVELPPPTTTGPADAAYHNQLQGQVPPSSTAPAPVAAVTEAAVPPPVVAPPVTAPPAAAAKTGGATPPAPKVAARQTESAADTKVAAKAAAVAPTGWAVQVGAYGSRENADKMVSQLKAKGYTAFVTVSPSRLFHVKVGPFPQRTEADRSATKLRADGYSGASVVR